MHVSPVPCFLSGETFPQLCMKRLYWLEAENVLLNQRGHLKRCETDDREVEKFGGE